MKLVKCHNCEEKFDPSKMDRCPECGVHYLPKRGRTAVTVHQHPLGYPQCDWRAENERCRYPGTMSSGTTGESAWYCCGHFACSNPVLGADIVRASSDYVHKTPGSDLPRLQAEAAQFCAKRGLSTVEQTREWIRENVKRVGAGPQDSVRWARRIVERIERGKKLPIIAERLAREALLRIVPALERQPGEDLEEVA